MCELCKTRGENRVFFIVRLKWVGVVGKMNTLIVQVKGIIPLRIFKAEP